MADPFASTSKNALSSATNLFLITPDDDNDLAIYTRGLSFAGAGDIEVILVDTATAVVIPSGALAAGIIHPLRVKRLLATNTTATGFVGYV